VGAGIRRKGREGGLGRVRRGRRIGGTVKSHRVLWFREGTGEHKN